MKRAVLICGLLLLLVANVLMMTMYSGREGFQTASPGATKTSGAVRGPAPAAKPPAAPAAKDTPAAKAAVDANAEKKMKADAMAAEKKMKEDAMAAEKKMKADAMAAEATAAAKEVGMTPDTPMGSMESAVKTVESFVNSMTKPKAGFQNGLPKKAGFQNMNGLPKKNNEGFESYFLNNAGGSGDNYQPIGAYDGISLKTGNDSAWRYTAPDEKLMGAEFNPGPDSLFIFKNNQCKPECCGSSFSCGGGCVCTTPQQRQYIAGRGGNRTKPEDSA